MCQEKRLIPRSRSSKIATLTFELLVFGIAAYFVMGATIDWLLP
jgi:hypothetical protein